MLFEEILDEPMARNNPLDETAELIVEVLLIKSGTAVIEKMIDFYDQAAFSHKTSGRMYDAEFAQTMARLMRNTLAIVSKIPDLD